MIISEGVASPNEAGAIPEVPGSEDGKMCSHAFPALYLNLGIEMMYVLDSRIRASKTVGEAVLQENREKSDRVMKELILGLLDKSTLKSVFLGLGMPTLQGLRVYFQKVAHASEMRLSESSMSKMFDLMTMAVKFAFMKITMPEQILTVTVNHLRDLLDLVPLDKEIGAAVEHCYTMLISFYRPLGPMGWAMLRNMLLVFFQDIRVKVSSLVRNRQQTANGKFIIYERSVPVQLPEGGAPVGLTTYFTEQGTVSHTSEFPTPYKYVPFEPYPNTLDAPRRSTDLGFNTYKAGADFKTFGGSHGKLPPNYKPGNEMALLESLISSNSADVDQSQLWEMSMFDDDQDEKNYLKESAESNKVVKIDASKKKKSLKNAMDDMKIDKARPPTAGKVKKTKGASMLDMMDEAAARPATAKTKAKRSESMGTSTAKPRTRSGSRPVTGERPTSAAPKRAASAKRRPA